MNEPLVEKKIEAPVSPPTKSKMESDSPASPPVQQESKAPEPVKEAVAEPKMGPPSEGDEPDAKPATPESEGDTTKAPVANATPDTPEQQVQTNATQEQVASANPSTSPAKRVTARKANTNGKVLVLEYHRVEPKESRWVRSIKKFKTDLERLYADGFRPVTLAEYVDNKMVLPPGASPVVITFDDSHPSQFKYLKNGDIDPNCAVGIWKAFADKHPDFPVKGTWFILPSIPWGQKATYKRKLKQLQEWGSEIASHSMSHPVLSKLSDEKVRGELSGMKEWLKKEGIECRTFAYPYGVKPRTMGPVKIYEAAVLGGSAPAPSPNVKNRRLYDIPRVQGIDIEYGFTYWLNRMKDGRVKAYVAP